MPTFLRPTAGVGYSGCWFPGWSSLELLDPGLISEIPLGSGFCVPSTILLFSLFSSLPVEKCVRHLLLYYFFSFHAAPSAMAPYLPNLGG